MPIDTRQKRQSSGFIGLPFKLGRVVPTGTLHKEARVAAGHYYSGVFEAGVITSRWHYWIFDQLGYLGYK